MGALGERYGYYGGNAHLGKLAPWPGLGLGGEGEALAIGDATGELWAFHILPGPSVSDGRGAVRAAAPRGRRAGVRGCLSAGLSVCGCRSVSGRSLPRVL